MQQILLSGQWEWRFVEEPNWRPIAVPGCWEALDVPKDKVGPAWYRTRFEVPPTDVGDRLWLRFDAVSYACTVIVNGHEVGSHIGLWDAFSVEITDAVVSGRTVELLVRVEKPASLVRGPGSRPVPGSFPLPETLSGFLPYVWGQIFGGIWQDVTLVVTGRVVFEDVYVRGTGHGDVKVEVALSAPGAVRLRIVDPQGIVVCDETRSGGREVCFGTTVADPDRWSPGHPALYEARL